MSGKITTRIQDRIALVTLDNPAKRNALSAAMWEELAAVFGRLSADTELRCVVIRGAGQDFAAGGDIAEFPEVRGTREKCLHFHQVTVGNALRAIDQCLHPTVALIRGNCVGGGLEIAAQCDLRIAGHSARFGAPIGRLGFTMAHTELANLVARVGPAVMLEILLEGRLMGADEAYRKGLVTRVVQDADTEEEALATARRIAAGAPLVARAHKKLVRRLAFRATPLDEGEIAENFAFLDSADYQEGLRAFLAKETPEFQGR
ncbi:MAG: enoyl-CoA hydratase/isomerase family protein [Pseudomonadota bacterium]